MRYTDEYLRDVDLAAAAVPRIEALDGASVLLTGGTGLICSSVADILLRRAKEHKAGVTLYLAGRDRERTARRFPFAQEGRDYRFVPFDAAGGEAPAVKADYIIHGAGNASPAAYVKEPVETMLANLWGTNVLLSLAAREGSRRFLFVSSSEVYGAKADARPYEERDYGFVDILNPRAAYPCAKRAAETLCAAYAAEHGVDAVIVRPGHIYGPAFTASDDRAYAQFIRRAAAHEDIIMKSAGTQMRSYCHALDCASAILTVLINGQAGEAYNISNRQSVVTIRDVAEALAAETGVQVRFENATDAEKKGYNLMDNSSLDASKLEALGWRACFDLRTGIRQTMRTL